MNIGQTIGSYRVLGKIGEGGMGEVYRARDTQLNRDVAIKVLPELFALDDERLARFTREAQTLAALNHPNIAHVHGLEKSDGTTALVMELVEGPTLEELIDQSGGIPLAEALPIARQIAEALEAAHEQAIVHRDLKPANIKVRADGTVKVLDFGLAKALDSNVSGAAEDPRHSPTLTARATQLGTIIGTAAYMSPEQARGKAVDKRADIWAFGVVFYEMLTGRRAFEGEDVSDVLAAVLRQDVDWSPLPEPTPARVRRLLARCLDRDPKTRLRDIGEARVEIAELERGGGGAEIIATPPAPSRRNWREVLAWSLAAAAIMALVGVAGLPPREAGLAPVIRLPFLPPDNVVIEDLSSTLISPDGGTVLFSGRARDGRQMLWVRPLDSAEATPLPDTEDALEAFWSPDSRSVAFGAQGKLKRVDLAGGRAETLTDAARLVGGAWSPAGVIVFGPDYGQPLVRIAEDGSGRTPVTRLDPERGGSGDRYPVFLPDGRHFLFASGSGVGRQAIAVGSIDAMEPRTLLPDFAPAIHVAPGWLLYSRHGTIVAQAFDAERLELSGEARPIAPAPQVNWAGGGRFSVSSNGVMVLQDPKGYDYQLTWFDRGGRAVGMLGPVVRTSLVQQPRISPDGRRVVVQRVDLTTRNQDLWIGDLSRGTFDRFTTDPAQEQLAIWSADGRSLLAATVRERIRGIFAFPVTGGPGRLLAQGTNFTHDVSPDGKWLFFGQRYETTRSDILARALFASPEMPPDRPPHAIVSTPFDELGTQVSPDSRWVAYVSDVTGTSEVYVRRLMDDGTVGESTRVSPSGGTHPRWSRDGRELFLVSTPQGFSSAQMMAVPVKLGGNGFEFGAPTPLFTVRMLPAQSLSRDYDVSLDGQRFLVGAVVGDASGAQITVVLNGMAALRPQ